MNSVGQSLIVISKSPEIRDGFWDSYTLLGYEVTACDDVVEVVRDLNLLDPDHVIMDIDELPRKWKIVASALKLAEKKITIILITSAMTLDAANEALVLGASGIIVKPFLPEFHLKRAYDIIHRRLRTEGKRIYPRFYAGAVFDGAFTVKAGEGYGGCSFELINVSEIGVAVRSRDPAAAIEIRPELVVDHAVLRIDNQEFPMSAHVVFRSQGLIGVRFQRFRDGHANFVRLIHRLSLKAFGISGIKGRW